MSAMCNDLANILENTETIWTTVTESEVKVSVPSAHA